MTAGCVRPPHLIVVGVDASGAEVARLVLGHGDDPAAMLASHGWEVRRAREVLSETVGGHVLTMSFDVERAPHVERAADVERSLLVEPTAPGPLTIVVPHRDENLVIHDGEVPHQHQRVAAYGFITSSRGVLMTQFSNRTNAQGQWGLPGGGLEPDEAPVLAVVREVWEESGQAIDVSELAVVQTSHWTGRAPGGRLEDFHAVRVVYRASCSVPTEPVVHDVGGTTASAAWVPPEELDRLDVTASWRLLLSAVVTAPDEADSAEHH